MVLLVACCGACRVDVAVKVAMDAQGAGTVTVTIVADKELLDRAPGIASDLRTEDVQAAGWKLAGPTATPEGGLELELTQSFTSPAQANAILAELNGPNGPFVGITLGRSKVGDTTSYTLNGLLQVTGGFEAFSDADLTAAVGATPYAAQVAQAGMQPADVVGVTFTATLPGRVNTTTATGGNGLHWTVPLDGTPVDVGTLSEHTVARNTWAKPVAKSAQVALWTWVAVAVCFIVYVIVVRRRRRRPRAWR